jgi:hypothetical protein
MGVFDPGGEQAAPCELVEAAAEDVVYCRGRWGGHVLLDVNTIEESWVLPK